MPRKAAAVLLASTHRVAVPRRTVPPGVSREFEGQSPHDDELYFRVEFGELTARPRPGSP